MAMTKEFRLNSNNPKRRYGKSFCSCGKQLSREKYTLCKSCAAKKRKSYFSEIMKLRWQNPEYRKHMSDVHKGQFVSLEKRAKISKFQKGKIKSQETRNKLRLVNLGKKHSEETKKKISLIQKGKKLSEITKQRLGESYLKHKQDCRCIACKSRRGEYRSSEETKRKIGLAGLGKKQNLSIRLKKSLYFSGNKSHFWRGGITPLNKNIRKLFEYRQWRSDVFTRDNFTCQECNKRGGSLEAHHHLKKFSKILEDNKIDNLEEARNCIELWNINNGITLCLDCHKKQK